MTADGPPSCSPGPWPQGLRGVTETVIATRGPNDRWNHAALGVHADGPESTRDADGSIEAVTAFTYGNTRTRRNLHREGAGVVQFTPDPVDFAEAALDVRETTERVLESASAWVAVTATRTDATERAGTTVETWRLEPADSEVSEQSIPVVNRGHAAVVEATVAASRLGVPGSDDADLHDRLEHALDVATTCGGPREHRAIRLVVELTADWNPPGDRLPPIDS